jgi:hypothetical protein
VGFKLGAFHSVGWWRLSLLPARGEPAPTRSVDTLRDDPAWRAALSTHLDAPRS